MIETYLNGYEHCRRARPRELREDKAAHFRRRVQTMYPILKVCRVFAPNARVRAMADDVERQRRDHWGAPSLAQRTAANVLVARAVGQQARMALGWGSAARTFPCKRYIYDRRPAPEMRPFRVEYDRPNLGFRVQRWMMQATGRA